MTFEFHSSTPLNVRDLNVKRPIRPLTTRTSSTLGNARPSAPESFLRSASSLHRKPLKSILKTKVDSNYRRPLRDLPSNYAIPPKSRFDFLGSLKGVSNKLFSTKDLTSTPSERVETKAPTRNHEFTPRSSQLDYSSNIPIRPQSTGQDESINTLRNQIDTLNKKIQTLEDENLSLQRKNRQNALKTELEKQELSVENELLKKKIDLMSKSQQKATEDLISSYRSRLTNTEIDSAADFTNMRSLYKAEPLTDISQGDNIKERIALRQKRHDSQRVDFLTDKIDHLEKLVKQLNSKVDTKQPFHSEDQQLLDQIKKIIDFSVSKKRTRDENLFDDDINDAQPFYGKRSKTQRTSKMRHDDLSEIEQLSPIRF